MTASTIQLPTKKQPFFRWPLSLVPVMALTILLSGCSLVRTYFPPAKPKQLHDDLAADSLRQAAARDLSWLERLPPDRSFTYCGKAYPASRLKESLVAFLKLLDESPSPAAFQQAVFENFQICRAGASNACGKTRRQLVTGYFEPVLDGSLSRVPPFIYPLYTTPADLKTVANPATGKKEFGRLVDGTLQPYWTRAELENSDRLSGSELVFLADPVDAFILHVQGSGKIRFNDGTTRGVHYAAANGRPYTSIGRVLIDEGRLRREEVDLPAIKHYLNEHPAERQRILQANESFIFFQWENSTDPIGSLGLPLTAGRSVAADQQCLPPGGLGYLESLQPIFDKNGIPADWIPLTRFVLIQDTGSAIKGPGRLDLYMGSGDEAGRTAGLMQHPGQLYLLIKK